MRCGHSPFCYNGRFLRATNHQPRTTLLFSDSMRLRRDELTIVLRPCAIRHKFRLCTKFRRPFWPVRCRPAEGAGRLPKRTAVAGRPLPSPTESQPGDKNDYCQPSTKNTRPTALCVGADQRNRISPIFVSQSFHSQAVEAAGFHGSIFS